MRPARVACLQLSVVLLVASAGYRLTSIGGLDSVGALIIGGLCFREGREAFEKARGGSFACTCGGSCEEPVTNHMQKGNESREGFFRKAAMKFLIPLIFELDP